MPKIHSLSGKPEVCDGTEYVTGQPDTKLPVTPQSKAITGPRSIHNPTTSGPICYVHIRHLALSTASETDSVIKHLMNVAFIWLYTQAYEGKLHKHSQVGTS